MQKLMIRVQDRAREIRSLQDEAPKLKAQLAEIKGIFKSKERKALETQMEHFKLELIEYLDYYNNRRIKAKLKGLPPAIHRQQALSVA